MLGGSARDDHQVTDDLLRLRPTWRSGDLAAGIAIVIFAPYFHRDDHTLEAAHRFTPELWLHDRGEDDWPLVPFSGGPGMCPGRNVVLLTSSMVLASLVRERDIRPVHPLDTQALPGTLRPFSARFTVT